MSIPIATIDINYFYSKRIAGAHENPQNVRSIKSNEKRQKNILNLKEGE